MNTVALSTLIITTISILVLFVFIDRTKKSQIKISFQLTLLCLLICCIGLILQIVFCNISDIPPIYFDYFVYIGTCFLPVAFLYTCLTFSKTKIIFNKKHLILFIVPILSLLILWTNDLHHLFYVNYSTNLNETVYGSYMIIHSAYSYLLIGIGLIYLFRYSFKNSGFFSRQSILIFLGALSCVLINMLGAFNIVNMSIYITPISFTVGISFFALAIFKFGFIKTTPIALQRIVDRMSDSYIVLNEDMVITDFNQTLLDTFKLSHFQIRNINIIDILKKFPGLNIDVEVFIAAVNKTKLDNSTFVIEKHWKSINKYFHIEINSITNNNNFLGTLILLKDVTQHNLDMQTIKENQEILIEKERLASLGQMIGGIAQYLVRQRVCLI